MPKLSFDVVSSRKCKCGKALKQNLVNKLPNAGRCFECYTNEVIVKHPGYRGNGRNMEK